MNPRKEVLEKFTIEKMLEWKKEQIPHSLIAKQLGCKGAFVKMVLGYPEIFLDLSEQEFAQFRAQKVDPTPKEPYRQWRIEEVLDWKRKKTIQSHIAQLKGCSIAMVGSVMCGRRGPLKGVDKETLRRIPLMGDVEFENLKEKLI